MSANVKIGNRVYNGISTVRLKNADDSGYSLFQLDEAVDPLYDIRAQRDTDVTVPHARIQDESFVYHDYSGAVISVSSSNHVKIRFTDNEPSSEGHTINITDIEYEGNKAGNNKPLWFTLPVGNAVLDITNIRNSSGLTLGWNFKKALNTSSADFNPGPAAYDNQDLHVQRTLSEPFDVGAFVVSIRGQISANDVVEFDFGLTVNGQLYL